MRLSWFELWHEPTAPLPHGTILALGYQEETTKWWFVEVDVARARPISQRPIDVPPDSRVRIIRAGDLIEVAAQQEGTFLWITYDSSLSERHRVNLPGMGRAALGEAQWTFSVADGRAIVMNRDTAVVNVFASNGARVAKHDCKPLSFLGFAQPRIAYANGLAIIENMNGRDHHSALCGFRIDGGGGTMRAEYDAEDAPLVLNGGAYLLRHDGKVFRLDHALAPAAPAVVDPRVKLSDSRCNVTGDVSKRDVWAWGMEIAVTGQCCGGRPGGLFVCSPPSGEEPPPTGTPGVLEGHARMRPAPGALELEGR